MLTSGEWEDHAIILIFPGFFALNFYLHILYISTMLTSARKKDVAFVCHEKWSL